MERRFSMILPLSEACQQWCEQRKLDVGPIMPLEESEAQEIQRSLELAGFREGLDYQVY